MSDTETADPTTATTTTTTDWSSWKTRFMLLFLIMLVLAVAGVLAWYLSPWGAKRCVSPSMLCPSAPPCPNTPSCPCPPPAPSVPRQMLISSPACSSPSGSPSSPPGCDPLIPGTSFSSSSQIFATDRNPTLQSASGQVVLTLNPDATVTFDSASGTQGFGTAVTHQPAVLTLQADGRVVSYSYTPDPTNPSSPAQVGWVFGPAANWGTPPYTLQINAQGQLALIDSTGKTGQLSS